MNPIILAILIAAAGFIVYAVVAFFYMLSKDPFDVFSEEENYKPQKDDNLLPFQNDCAGRNYWI